MNMMWHAKSVSDLAAFYDVMIIRYRKAPRHFMRLGSLGQRELEA